MNRLLDFWDIAAELQWVIFIILCILVASSVAWNLWNLIKSTMTGRAVLLTTHSMLEADALCDRIGIQVRGQFHCCLLYTSPSPRDVEESRMPSSA